MKWIKIIIALAEILIPGLAKAGKNKLADELEVAQGALKELTSKLTPGEKASVIIRAAGDLRAVKQFKKRVSKRIDKAQDRLVKKFL